MRCVCVCVCVLHAHVMHTSRRGYHSRSPAFKQSYLHMMEQALKLGETQLLLAAGHQVGVILAPNRPQYLAWVSEALGCVQNVKRLFVSSVEGEFNETFGLAVGPFDVEHFDKEHPGLSLKDLAATFQPLADVAGVSASELAEQYYGSLSLARHYARQGNMSIDDIWRRTLQQLHQRRTRMDTQALRRAVQWLMVVTPSTGEVESTFSYVEMLGSRRRSSITLDHLKASLKVLKSKEVPNFNMRFWWAGVHVVLKDRFCDSSSVLLLRVVACSHTPEVFLDAPPTDVFAPQSTSGLVSVQVASPLLIAAQTAYAKRYGSKNLSHSDASRAGHHKPPRSDVGQTHRVQSSFASGLRDRRSEMQRSMADTPRANPTCSEDVSVHAATLAQSEQQWTDEQEKFLQEQVAKKAAKKRKYGEDVAEPTRSMRTKLQKLESEHAQMKDALQQACVGMSLHCHKILTGSVGHRETSTPKCPHIRSPAPHVGGALIEFVCRAAGHCGAVWHPFLGCI